MKDILDLVKSREIVSEIMKFGVSQKQILRIIYLLALELEQREHMLNISNLVQEIENGSSTKNILS